MEYYDFYPKNYSSMITNQNSYEILRLVFSLVVDYKIYLVITTYITYGLSYGMFYLSVVVLCVTLFQNVIRTLNKDCFQQTKNLNF